MRHFARVQSNESAQPPLECRSARDARQRLEAYLDSLGASLEPVHEPGLSDMQRYEEDLLRSVIRFLRSIEDKA